MEANKKDLQASLDMALRYTPNRFSVTGEVHTLPVYEIPNQKIILDNLDNWHYKEKVDNPNKKYAHIGVAGFFNLQAICKGRHDVAILVDCNNEQTYFWEDIIKLLKKHSTADKFLEDITKRIDRNDEYTNSTKMAISLRPMLDDFGDKSGVLLKDVIPKWLKNSGILEDDNYRHLHKMAVDGRILTTELDVHDEKRISAIRNWLDENNIKVRSVYASNILDLESVRIKGEENFLPDVKVLKDNNGSAFSISYVDNISRKPLDKQHPFINGVKYFEEIGMKRGGFYADGNGELQLHLLLNDDSSELFHCSDYDYSPLITIKGEHSAKLLSERARNSVITK